MAIEDEKINIDLHRSFCWFSAIILLAVITIQITITHQTPRNATSTQQSHRLLFWTLMVTYLALTLHLISHLARIYQWPSCIECHFWFLFGSIIYVLSRALIYLFMVQRARMSQIINSSQGITSSASPNCFKYYFPIVLFVIWIGSTFGVINMNSMDNVTVICTDHCSFNYKITGSTMTPILGALAEVIMNAVLLYLFAKPFSMIGNQVTEVNELQLQSDHESNLHTERSSKKVKSNAVFKVIKAELRWNMIMMTINLVTTNVISIGFRFISYQFVYCWPLDIALNATTLLLMFGRNREWISNRIHKLFDHWVGLRCCHLIYVSISTSRTASKETRMVGDWEEQFASTAAHSLDTINETSAEVAASQRSRSNQSKNDISAVSLQISVNSEENVEAETISV